MRNLLVELHVSGEIFKRDDNSCISFFRSPPIRWMGGFVFAKIDVRRKEGNKNA